MCLPLWLLCHTGDNFERTCDIAIGKFTYANIHVKSFIENIYRFGTTRYSLPLHARPSLVMYASPRLGLFFIIDNWLFFSYSVRKKSEIWRPGINYLCQHTWRKLQSSLAYSRLCLLILLHWSPFLCSSIFCTLNRGQPTNGII